MSVFERLRALDAHPKTRDEFRVRTLQGGLTSVCALLVACWLVRSEMRHSFKRRTHDRLFVNSTHGAGVSVAFEIEFPAVACDVIGVDAMDASGQRMEGFVQHVHKTRLDKEGRAVLHRVKSQVGETATHEDHLGGEDATSPTCGDCYGAGEEGECCDSCDQVRSAYRKKGWTFKATDSITQCAGSALDAGKENQAGEGCVLEGELELPAVSGNFHFAPGRNLNKQQRQTTQRLIQMTFEQFNISHTIKSIAFNEPPETTERKRVLAEAARDATRVYAKKSIKKLPKKTTLTKKQRRALKADKADPLLAQFRSQLDGAVRHVADGFGMHQYYLKVVPTTYKPLGAPAKPVSQYSATEHLRHVAPGSGRGLPGVFFFYEVSPLCAEFVEERAGWRALATGFMAIVGGVHVTAGLVDRAIAFSLARLTNRRGAKALG